MYVRQPLDRELYGTKDKQEPPKCHYCNKGERARDPLLEFSGPMVAEFLAHPSCYYKVRAHITGR